MWVRLAPRTPSPLCAGLAALALSFATRAESVDVELASKIPPKGRVSDRDACISIGEGANASRFVQQTGTLGVEMENGRPRVLLDLAGSESEGLDWDPKIFAISKSVR